MFATGEIIAFNRHLVKCTAHEIRESPTIHSFKERFKIYLLEIHFSKKSILNIWKQTIAQWNMSTHKCFRKSHRTFEKLEAWNRGIEMSHEWFYPPFVVLVLDNMSKTFCVYFVQIHNKMSWFLKSQIW